ncbi:MAG TPA: diacylglycerol kinase family protein [Gaiellaceae bacterium]|nr:diacylglycerol kinase family protein [Gaiellaceae bacterium]
MRGLLLVNPRSGKGGPSVAELERAAAALDVAVRALEPGDDLAALAREADAEMLGMAGGDGSLGAVAGVAVERGLPFVCVPYGTRNHFARDVGLDDSQPLQALAAFGAGLERRVDVGRVGDRVFLNNVSLGIYAQLVHRREHHRRRDAAFARLRALALSLRDHRRTERFVVAGQEVRASVVLVANNEYRLDLFSLGARERLDGGALHVYSARGLRRLRWTETSVEEVTIETRTSPARAAVDGEPVDLRSPLRLRVDPGGLRLLLPARA